MPSLTILKLGGSLLDLPDVVLRISALIRRHEIAQPLIVPGGGEAADLVRAWSVRFSLSELAAHWLAIEAMSLNARLLAAADCAVQTDHALQLVSTRAAAVEALAKNRLPVFDAAAGLRCAEVQEIDDCGAPPAEALPQSWNVTSDSIAAWLALRWQANSVWLLKSVGTDGKTCDELAAAGAIDQHFATCACAVREILWVNLRSSPHDPVRLCCDR